MKVNASFDATADCGGAVDCLIGDDFEVELAIHTRSSGNTGNSASVSGCPDLIERDRVRKRKRMTKERL